MAGLSYTLELSVSYGSSPTSTAATASITLNINGPPYGGLLSVTPPRSAALSILFFSFNTLNWVDVVSDFPLQYSIGYYAASSSAPYFVKSKSSLAYVNFYVGPAPAIVGYAVTCVASARYLRGGRQHYYNCDRLTDSISFSTAESSLPAIESCGSHTKYGPPSSTSEHYCSECESGQLYRCT